MGKFIEVSSIKWPVEVFIPKNNGQKAYDKQTIKLEYNVLPQDELDAAPMFSEKNSTPEEIRDVIKKRQQMAIDNIAGFEIEGLPFNSDNLAKVLDNPYYHKAITNGFWECQNGKQ